MARESRMMNHASSWATIAAREHLESGARLTYLEAMLLFGVRNFTVFITRLRRSGIRVESQTVSYAKALRRLNESTTVIPPSNLPIRELKLTEYWISR